jgi:hypothetical protein
MRSYKTLAVALVCALECNPFASSPPQARYPAMVPPSYLLGIPIEDLRVGQVPRPRLESAARMIDQLYDWRSPVALPDAGPYLFSLAGAYRDEALRGDPTHAVRMAVTVLRLAAILEAQPMGDHPDGWLSRPHFLRNLICRALRDPRTIAGAAPAELERLRAVLAENEPPADQWERAVRAMPDAIMRQSGEALYQNRGRLNVQGYWPEQMVIPTDAAERGLWIETARERLHDHARRMIELVTADHDATMNALYALRKAAEDPGTVLDRMLRKVSAGARARESARFCLMHLMMMVNLRSLVATSAQNQRRLLELVRLEQARRAKL